ncbi:MAG: arginine repressor, partial [Calditrichia bacterium]
YKLENKGYSTTQATLSRDLHEMGIIRIPSPDGYRYIISELEGNHSFAKIVGLEILGIYYNEHVVVVRTITGRATGVALFIDQLKHENVLGTVAGENSIIVIPDSVQNIPRIKADLERIVCQKWS